MTLVEALQANCGNFAQTFADMEAYQVFGNEMYRMLLSKFMEYLLVQQDWFSELFTTHNPSGGYNWTFKETGEKIGLRTGRAAIFKPNKLKNRCESKIIWTNRRGEGRFKVKYDYLLAIQYQKPPGQLFGMSLISSAKLQKGVEAEDKKFVVSIDEDEWDLRILAGNFLAERQTDKNVLLNVFEASLKRAFGDLVKTGMIFPVSAKFCRRG